MHQTNLLKNKDFLKLLIAQGVSDFGDGVAFLGFIMVVLYRHSGTAVETSLIFICASLPVLIVGPFAGVFVDRWNRKHTMIVSDILRAAAVCILIFVENLWGIYFVVFIVSTLSRFFYPARGAIIPNIVGKENVHRANGISQAVMYAMSVFSPSASGVLIGLLGVKSVFVLDAISFLFSGMIVFSLRYREDSVSAKPGSVSGVLMEMKTGVKLIQKTPQVRYILLSFSVILLFAGPVNVLYLMFLRDVMKLDIVWVGYLESVFGLGAVCGGIILSLLPKSTRNADILVGGTFSGLVIAFLVFFPKLLIVTIGLFLVGCLIVFINVPPTAIVQKTIADRARGKVLSVMNALFQMMNMVSMILVSIALSIVDIRHILIIGGLLLTVLGIFFFSRNEIRKLLG
ncbi:MAG: MFS transporter [Thermoplasmata archaeon]